MKDWLPVLWNRRPRVVLRIWGMLVLYALRKFYNQKGNLTQFYKHVMSSQLQILVVKKLFKDHVKLLQGEWLLGGDHVLPHPVGRIKQPGVMELGQHV
jgi:hypothetical protein